MKTQEKPNQSLLYQKQLYSTLKSIVDLRTQLISNAAIIANDGKDKEWPTISSKIKFIKNKTEKDQNETLIIISQILKNLEEPIIILEKKLELKNSFLEIITEQSFKEIETI